MIYKLFGGPEDGMEISILDPPGGTILILQEPFEVGLSLSNPDEDLYRRRVLIAVYEKRDIGDAHFVGWKGGD